MKHDIDKIYKYMSFKSVVRLFECHHVRMTQPASLNDLFENPIILDGSDPFQRAIERYNLNNEIAITSYTETPTNLLMWSHYADEYKGVAVGFNTIDPFFDNLRRIRYHEHRGTGKNQPNEAILLKGNDWMYEKEWRQVWHSPSHPRLINEKRHDFGYNSGNGIDESNDVIYLRKIPIETISEIIYGPRFFENEDFEEAKLDKRVKDVTGFTVHLQNNFPNILRKFAQASEDRFELRIQSMPNNY